MDLKEAREVLVVLRATRAGTREPLIRGVPYLAKVSGALEAALAEVDRLTVIEAESMVYADRYRCLKRRIRAGDDPEQAIDASQQIHN
jgi:hypothetical protein